MAARASIEKLVSRLRSITGAARDDAFNGETYWSDEQLEAELDAKRVPMYDIRLRLLKNFGSYAEYVFPIPRGSWLEHDYTVRRVGGSEVNEPYTVILGDELGRVVFEGAVPTGSLVIDVYAIDWNAAAASVWEQKAAHRFDYVTVKAADYRFDAQQEYEHCVQRAKWYKARSIKTFSQPKRGFVAENNRRLGGRR